MLDLINYQAVFNINSYKFFRRYDLTPELRLQIAYEASIGNWGKITELSNKYNLSRTFIYELKNTLNEITSIAFGIENRSPYTPELRDILSYILSIRLEGKSSLIAISTIMQRFSKTKYCSVGAISQILNFFGDHVSNTIQNYNNEIHLVIFASDEVYTHNKPILVTVDPISSAILRMELVDSKVTSKWINHWECLEKNNYLAIYLVNDDGTSMKSAKKKVMPNITRQADTFHGIAHRLGLWLSRFETSSEKAIIKEYDRLNRLDNAKSDKAINKVIRECDQAQQDTEVAMANYDNFHFLYLELISNLQVFNKDGQLNCRKIAEENVTIILELLDLIENNNLKKELKKIKNILPELFPYLDEGKKVIFCLKQQGIPDNILNLFCLAWQYQKNRIKAKDVNRKNYFKKKESNTLLLLNCISKDYKILKDLIYSKLDTITQSSAMVENINSILRMYFNTTKNHVNQNLLNLIMFYHNHRFFYAGKRKNKSPMEILTGKKQEKDWLELILDKVPWQQFNFLKLA